MAFISSNSRDFCGTEAGTLAPTLQADVAERKVRLAYYSSLDDFLRDHAAPIAHFTVDWVEERLDGVEVEKMITRYLGVLRPRAVPALVALRRVAARRISAHPHRRGRPH